MSFVRKLPVLVAVGITLAGQANALTVTPTTTGATLLGALLPSSTGFGTVTAAYDFGTSAQVGTFTGFTSGPVTLPAGGIVLSTGNAANTTAASHSTGDSPSTNINGSSTPEITAYAPGKITNFTSARDAARLTVSFSLAAASAISFDFVFGSTEYPVYSSQYTDAAYVFLDGAQVAFDASGAPIQVGANFSSQLTIADTNTAFSSPHGVIGVLTTTSATLAVGTHKLQFEVADTNDGFLDSALFVSNLRLSANSGGPVTGTTKISEPAALALLATGLLGLVSTRRRMV